MSISFSYSGDPSSSDKDAVRSEIRDTNSSAWLLSDNEIEYYILDENTVAAGTPATITGVTLYGPAARCCEVISRSFLAQADTQVGQLRVTSTARAQRYADMASMLRLKAQGYAVPYAGGQSITEKREFQSDADTVQPAFTRREFDNPYTGSQDGFSNDNFGPPVA